MLRSHHLGRFSEDTTAASLDEDVTGCPDARVRSQTRGGVGCPALDADQQLRIVGLLAAHARGIDKHLTSQSGALRQSSAGPSQLMDDNLVDALSCGGDALYYVIDGSFAAKAYQQHTGQIGIAAKGNQGAVDHLHVGLTLATALLVYEEGAFGKVSGNPLGHVVGAGHCRDNSDVVSGADGTIRAGITPKAHFSTSISISL